MQKSNETANKCLWFSPKAGKLNSAFYLCKQFGPRMGRLILKLLGPACTRSKLFANVRSVLGLKCWPSDSFLENLLVKKMDYEKYKQTTKSMLNYM